MMTFIAITITILVPMLVLSFVRALPVLRTVHRLLKKKDRGDPRTWR